MLNFSEYPNNKQEVLYDLRVSLPYLPTTILWGYVPPGRRIRVQVQHLLPLGVQDNFNT